MEKSMRHWVRLLALLLFAPLVQASFSEGTEYQKLANPQPTTADEKIEVLELFWYGCPHCYHLEPALKSWLENKPEDVVFVRMPAVLGPNWELLARAYYTAELLDVEDRLHPALFAHIHKDRKRILNVAQLKNFFAKHGVPEQDFENTFSSFAVITRTNRAKQVRSLYGITGVPTVVVNGKYRTSATMAGDNDKLFKVIEYLIERERAGSDTAHAAAE
jgi:thiol:disulfide interchange protein DsbA